jgi:hypothetical protein
MGTGRAAALACACAALAACGGGASGQDADAGESTIPDTTIEGDAPGPSEGWPAANEWSWNGSWTPSLPLGCLLDDEYGDGHAGTPVLPPGEWDWDDAADDLANWRNFSTSIGTFERLLDGSGGHYGWILAPLDPVACDFSGAAAYFEGSCGTDVIDLGPAGSIHSYASGNLAGGPDVLVVAASHSLDFRTGSSTSGPGADDDLLVAGCGGNPDGSFDVMTSTFHMGPGADWAFVRDISRAAVDLGNGESGRTDALDPGDGDDLVVLRGNTHDFRVFAGAGDDTAVWYVDENVQTTTWLGPNFFGGGGHGDAIWQDVGTDRLVLAIDPASPVVSTTPTPPGSVLVRATAGDLVLDEPTQDDPFARYCVECGTSPAGAKTLILEYVSPDGSVHTGYFYVTAFEELQIGVGPAARVYDLDDVGGGASPSDAPAFDPPAWPGGLCL